ncbi:hypothetical protein SJAG_05291 [Schizosaccharomyces japonicus yFS275]|uniref:Mid2 domain-containing protein n=1 Tax=Schizosaccharomyces japonicus (strain yFS275 / FY16936) TaxID=402676 RepID=B6K3I4_SCHJY|nr:hypothetical protein SJAG_05291 [Schizosaccharomyces japonicus yFS275]EEB08041.1 hypothetical protein SJAG_05291 [Schizosaccharomyces japonicus yFS275]
MRRNVFLLCVIALLASCVHAHQFPTYTPTPTTWTASIPTPVSHPQALQSNILHLDVESSSSAVVSPVVDQQSISSSSGSSSEASRSTTVSPITTSSAASVSSEATISTGTVTSQSAKSTTNTTDEREKETVTVYVTIQPTNIITTIFQFTSVASTIPAQSGIATIVPVVHTFTYGNVGTLVGVLVGTVVGMAVLLASVLVIARIWGPKLLLKNTYEDDQSAIEMDNFDNNRPQSNMPEITLASNF